MLFSAIVLYLFLGGLWLIVGIKTGYFIYQPFAAIPLILLLYLSLISIIALLTVLVENFFVAAGVTTGFYFVTTVLGQLEYVFDENPTMHFGWVIIHGALPRIGELTAAVNSLYQPNEPVEWVSPVLITLLFSAVVLTAATFLFWRKEY